jgi:hypothetical protein
MVGDHDGAARVKGFRSFLAFGSMIVKKEERPVLS